MSERATFTIEAPHPTVHDRARHQVGLIRLLESRGYTVQRIDVAGQTVERGITPLRARRASRSPDVVDWGMGV